MANATADVTAEDIDNMLDEIEQNEVETSAVTQKDIAPTNGANWKQILTQLQNGNSNFVKSLITSKDIDVNEQDPANGMSILIYVTIIGNYDLVKLVCNFGGNVHTKDHSGCDALDYAQRYGRYAITELLFYRQLSGSLGNDLKAIATSIYDKNEEAKRLKANDTDGYDSGEHSIRICHNIIKAMIKAIEKRDPFSPDLLYYAWYFYLEQCEKAKQDPLTTEFPENKDEKPDNGFYNSRDEEYAAERRRREKNDAHLLTLWRVMMTAYEEILCDTSDKKGWEWLKGYFINSLIWFLPHPTNKGKKGSDDTDTKEDNDEDDMEYILSTTLFYELLTRVRTESKAQSDLLLKEKIDSIKSETPQEWETLIAYHVTTEFSTNARQDVCKCIEPKYTKEDLNETLYPPSTHFSAQKHYDTNIYLNELLFRANIMDTMFQLDMKKLTKEISAVTGFDSPYRAGPVKTLTRSQTKVENDYIEEDYPTAAKILDINRCAIQFESINAMMQYIQLFTERISKKQAYSIVEIIRCKNGWSAYNPEQPAYTDVKLNVLVQSPKDGTVIAEIQLLLKLMSAFKKKAHKLYSVERKFELVYNFNKLQNKMSQFKDLMGHENIMIDLLKRNELESFKSYWLIITNEEDLSHSINALIPTKKEPGNPWKVPFFYVLMVDANGNDIYNYLVQHFSHVLSQALEAYLQKYYEKGYSAFLNDLYNSQEKKKEFTQDELVIKFLHKIYDFTNVNAASQSETLTKLFTIEDKSKQSLVSAIVAAYSESKFCGKSFKFIIDNEAISYEDKIKIFAAPSSGLLSALKHKYMNHISEILFYFNGRKDKQRLMDVLKWAPKKKSSRIGFLFLCTKITDKRSLLPFVLNNPMVNKDELNEMMLLADDTIYTSVEVSLKGNTLNTHLILRYINDIGKIMNLITEDCVKELKLNSECVLVLLKYIGDDKQNLVRLLGEFGLFAQIMKKNRVKLMKYILYESNLTPQDILGFIDKKCIFDYPSDIHMPDANCATEVIRYFKDDEKSLVQILEMVYTNRSLFKMLYAKYTSNETRQILFHDSALTSDTMYDFLKRNENGKGVGDHDHDFGPKKETTFFKLVQGYHGGKNTTDLVNYLSDEQLQSLLLQKHTKGAKGGEAYISKLDRTDTLESIYSKLIYKEDRSVGNIQAIRAFHETIEIGDNAAQRKIAARYKEYLEFCDSDSYQRELKSDLNADPFVDIDINDHPLRTACFCGDHTMIDLFLKAWIWDKDGKNLFDILNKPKIINKLFCNGNDDAINIKTLRILILDNQYLSDAQKFDLIHATTPPFEDDKKNYDIIITPAFVDTTNALRVEVLNYFQEQGNKEYVLRLLQEKVSWINRRGARKLQSVPPLHAICRAFGKTKIPPIEFIIDCPLLTDEEKIKLLDDSFVDVAKLDEGLSLNVLQFIGSRDDGKQLLMQFLSKKDSETSEPVLMLMMKGEASKDSESLLYILEHKALTYEYKRKLVFEEVYTFDEKEANSSTYWGFGPYQHVFALACKAYHDTKFIEKICDYFDVEKDGNFEKTGDILVKIEAVPHLKIVLNRIRDNKLMKQLFSTKSEDLNAFGATVYEQCQHYGPKGHSFKDDVEPLEIRNRRKCEMIQRYQEYLGLDESLKDGDEKQSEIEINISFHEYAEYWTNPWITCCEFGRMETMMKLLRYVIQRDDAKYTTLGGLLVNNYDLVTGNDWMMTLFVSGYKEMIIKILQQLEQMVKDTFVDIMETVLTVKNKVSGKTFLMMIGVDDDNRALLDAILSIVKDKKRVADILNYKDDSGNTCVYYAKENTKNMMQKYLK